ncbi:MAG: riboflavin biosynthesis protein RibF [Eubacteriales bacterium]|nr:riboflavin biosynthesis protein RibF [Eubacteriales bacterium]
MEYIRTDGDFPRLSDSSVTLGKFDGVHRGHRKLIEQVLLKKDEGNIGVMFAFEMSDQMIFSREERKDLLRDLGMDVLIECPLSEKIRHMKAESFVKEILVGDLKASSVVIGEDYRFGFERKGTPALLKKLGEKYGFETIVIPKEKEGRRKVSSTYIRDQLRTGKIEKVNQLLGTRFFLKGVVEHGAGLGHKVLLPTVNLIPPKEKLMPPNGVYFTRSRFGEECFEGITNVGYKPTVDGSYLGVETYLFGCDKDLYGRDCLVEFFHYERPEFHFSGLPELKKQLLKDAELGKEFFEGLQK